MNLFRRPETGDRRPETRVATGLMPGVWSWSWSRGVYACAGQFVWLSGPPVAASDDTTWQLSQ